MSHTPATITEIPIESLHESPFNPRKIYDDQGLADLATNIRAEGRVLQPLLVRPRTPPLFTGDPDATVGYEIVFGHRRYRAAEIAGLAALPCMVRSMADDEARRAQISENLQRTDVHPIEEAEGFQALLDAGRGDDALTADDLAEQFGKSRSYVYGRLKLLQACPEIRKACLAGEIGSEVALLIARLRTDKLQEKALGYIRGDYRAKLDDGGKASYRQIRALLNEKFTPDLKGAIFDIEDEMLVPLAGHCLRCPKRTGNAPEFDDVANDAAMHGRSDRTHLGPDVCTDPDCFAAKKTAHLKREADKLAATGKTVVQGGAARSAISAHGEIKGAYIALKDATAAIKSIKGGAATVATVTIQDPRTGKTFKAVKRDDLKAAGVKVKEAPKPKDDWQERQRQADAERAERTAKADALTAVNIAILDRTLDAMRTQPRTTQELAWMARRVFEGTDWGVCERLAQRHGMKRGDDLEKVFGQWPADRLALFAIECVLLEDAVVEAHEIGNRTAKDRAKLLLATAAHYGVDLGAGVKVTSTPAAAAQAPKGAAAGAKRKPGPKPKSKPPKQTDDAGVAGGRGAQVDAFEEAVA